MIAEATEAKPVVRPEVARAVVELSVESPAPPAPVVEEKVAPKPCWKFVKLFGVGETLIFRDGSKFKFRFVRQNDKRGFAPTSEVVTEDEKLAKNLRAAAKAGTHGVVEVKL